MTITAQPITGSMKVVAVGHPALIMRGRPAEFRHKGLALVSAPTAMAALLEVARDAGAIVLVPTHLSDMSVIDFVDVLRSVAHVPVIAGVVPGCPREVVSELFDHGIASTVALPATPGRLADAVLASQSPEQPEEFSLEVGHLTLDDARHRVTWFGNEVTLPPQNFAILRHLLIAHPRVVPIQELVAFIGEASDRVGRARAAVSRLRATFAEVTPLYDTPIETVHHIGYRLRP